MRKSSHLLVLSLLVVLLPGVLCAVEEAAKPTLEITAPPGDSIISGTEVEVAAKFAASEKEPVTRIQVFLDGKFITERKYDTGRNEGITSFKWDTTRTPNGAHKLDIQMFAGDKYLGMASCSINVLNKAKDLAPPRVALQYPKDGATVSGIVPILVETSDDSGRDPMVNVYVDRSLRSVKNRGPYEYSWDTTEYANGPHTIEVVAEDDAGNSSPMKAIRVTVRNMVAQQPIMLQSSAPTKSAPVAKSAATPVAPRVSSEVARTEPAKTESFEVNRPAPKPVSSAAKPAPKVETAQPEPKPTLVAKAPADPVQVAQCLGGVCPLEKASEPQESAEPACEAPCETPCEVACTVYVVKEGDNLYTLAKRMGVTTYAIASANKLADPSKLRIGQKLIIPPAPKMIPVRPVFEAAGGYLAWECGAKAVRAIAPQTDVLFRIGSTRAVVNSKSVRMDGAAVVDAGRTMVPESFVDSLGMGALGQ